MKRSTRRAKAALDEMKRSRRSKLPDVIVSAFEWQLRKYRWDHAHKAGDSTVSFVHRSNDNRRFLVSYGV